MRTKAVITLFILVFLFIFINPIVSNISFASTSNITYESVNPDSELQYKIKRLSEKVEGFYINIFKSDQKTNYLSKLVERRFKEYVYIIENNKASHLEVATSRYITHVGLLSEEVAKVNQDNDFNSKYENHSNILSSLQGKFPSQTAEWIFVQQAIDTSDVFVSQLN